MPITKAQREILFRAFLFEKLEPTELAPFFSKLTAVRFPAGAEIYTAGRFRKSIGIFVGGTALVRKGSVILNTLRVGDCFGVAALFHPVEEYVATVQAKTAAELVFITDSELTALFAQFPQTAVNYIAFLSRRIDFLNRKIDSFTAPSAQAGLCRFLRENREGDTVTVRDGYAGLARQLNMGRASLYRSLDQLEKSGVIRRAERIITILDPDAVAAQMNLQMEEPT